MKAKQTADDEKRKLARLEAAMRRTKARWLKSEETLRKTKEPIRLTEQIEKGVDELIKMAEKDDPLATAGLAKIATSATAALNTIAKKRPDLVLPLSRNVFAWPSFVSHKRAITRNNNELLEKLQIGKGGVFSSGKWQLSAPSTGFAMTLFSYGKTLEEGQMLPRLTATNKKVWFNNIWEILLRDGFRPEENPFLAPLGASKANRRPRYCKKLRPRTQIANIRAEIKQRVWEAFDNTFAQQK
jgi:hypothetical protein